MFQHFCHGFVEVFVGIDDQSANRLAVTDECLHLGKEGILKLLVSITLVAEFQHQVENLSDGAFGKRHKVPANPLSVAEGV